MFVVGEAAEVEEETMVAAVTEVTEGHRSKKIIPYITHRMLNI